MCEILEPTLTTVITKTWFLSGRWEALWSGRAFTFLEQGMDLTDERWERFEAQVCELSHRVNDQGKP